MTTNTHYLPFQPTLTSIGLNQLGLSMETTSPCDALFGVVHSYLQIRAERQTHYPVMPDGTQALYISSQGTMISGALTETHDLPLLHPGEYFGIWFYPGALRHFFSLNLAEITGEFVDEKYLSCARLVFLHEEIYRKHAFVDRVKVCEQWLLDHFDPQPVARFDHALSLIYRSFGNERIESIANTVGWSSRHLNRQFLQHTGLSTKTFSKVIRAQRACQQYFRALFDAPFHSVDLGYYDQAHLIKDFRRYFNSTPGDFRRVINQVVRRPTFAKGD